MPYLPREIYTFYYARKNLPVDNICLAYATIKKFNSSETVRYLLPNTLSYNITKGSNAVN